MNNLYDSFDFNNPKKKDSSNNTGQNSNHYNPSDYYNKYSGYNSYGNSVYNADPDFGLKSYQAKNSSNLTQMRIIQQATKPVAEDTDAGKGGKQIYEYYQGTNSYLKNAVCQSELRDFNATLGSITKLEKEMNSKGYNFNSIYDHSQSDAGSFYNALKGSNYTDVVLQSSRSEMLKTGEVKFTATDKLGESRLVTEKLDKINVSINNGADLTSGRKWLQSFADTTHDRQRKLIQNGDLTNNFLRTDADLKRFNIDRMSSTQLKKQVELLKTGKEGVSVFAGYGKELEATDKISLLEEVIKVKQGQEIAQRAALSKRQLKRVQRKQIMRDGMNKASSGDDALSGFQQLATGKDLIKMAVKTPVAMNKSYHKMNRRTLERQANSNIGFVNRHAKREYERLYGEKGKITKRDARVSKIKEKTDIKGKIKQKAKDSKLGQKKLARKNRRKKMFEVKKPKVISKIFSKLNRIKEIFTNPLKALGRFIIEKILKTKIVVAITGFIGSFFSGLVFIVGSFFSTVSHAIIAVVVGLTFVTIMTVGPVIILGLAASAVVGAISGLINTFQGNSMTVQEISKDAIYEDLEGYYTDDEIDQIMRTLSEKSGLNIGFISEDENNPQNNRYGLGGLTSSEFTEMAEWAFNNGTSFNPIEGEIDKNGNATQAYISRVTQLQTQYLRESGRLDEFIN